MPTDSNPPGDRTTPESTRGIVARGFTLVEDVVYVGLGVLLSASALVLLASTSFGFVRDLAHSANGAGVILLLDNLLLVLMVVELLYTVQVSFREHAIVPEPFLVVGLVAVIRRILVITAETTELQMKTEFAFRIAVIELALLTLMVVAFVGSLLMLRRHGRAAVAPRG